MKADERRALLGDAIVDHVRAEARTAAEEYPPGPEVIAALRPILTAQRTVPVKKQAKARMPMAA